MALVAVSTIISDVQTMLDDPSNPTSTQIIRFLNRARAEIARDINYYEKEVSFSSSTTTYQYSLPTDCNKVKSVEFKNVDNWNRICPLSEREWTEIDLTQTAIQYSNYFEQNYTLNLIPRLQNSANVVTVTTAMSPLDITMTVSDVSVLPTVGKVLVDSEVIYYNGKDSTNNVLQNLVRGQEGTIAASHNYLANVTERDVIVKYYAMPADIGLGDSIDQAFNNNPDVLQYYCAWQAKIRDMDDTNPSANAQVQLFAGLYQKAVAEMKYNLRGRKDGPNKVLEVNTYGTSRNY